MAKITQMLDVGRRGLAISQTAMQTTAHNITNKDVEGYSRQRVELKTNPPIGQGAHQVGTGARLAGISRSNNPWIEKQLEREGSVFAHADQLAQGLSRLETVINEQAATGLNDSIGTFFNSFRDLANNPESAVSRSQVKEASLNLLTQFKRAKDSLMNVKTDMNKNIEYSVVEVNGYAKEIALLNERIKNIEVGGTETANDERDQRDGLMKKLSEKIDVSYAEDPHTGMINITAGKTAVLVAGSSYTQLKTNEGADGSMRVINELSQGGTLFDITDQFTKGKVGAALEVRDKHTKDLLQNLDQLAYGITSEVNKVHQEGYDRYNQTGIKLFDFEKPEQGFSIDNLIVSREIVKDPARLAMASKPNSPGDNTVANVIQNLQLRPMMEDGKYSFDNFYNSKIGELGVLTQRANSHVETQRQALTQLKNIREGVSGVSMDEEAAKMIEQQKAFEASARLIRTADEMFDTVLNLRR